MWRGGLNLPRPWNIETLRRDLGYRSSISLQRESPIGAAMTTSSVMLSYLQKRVEENPGIKVSKLPGHMAQLPVEVRAKHGANEIAIRKFIQEHSEVFKIDKDDGVFVRPAVAKDVTSGLLLSHLQKCLETNQGIKVGELRGYLDPLPMEVRENHAANDSAVRSFVEKHSEVFVIDGSDRVFIRQKTPAKTKPAPAKTELPPAFVRPKAPEKTELAPAKTKLAPAEDLTELRNVTGKVSRIITTFGFIEVEKPIKTTVYFGVKQFEDGRHTNLPLLAGDSVVLDATRTVGHKAQFKATHVRRVVVKQAPRSKPAKVEPESDEDHLYNQSGVIHTVKPGYGFITFGPKKRSCSFFHGTVVDKAVAKGGRNLTDIFTVGDRVRFDAVPDTKPSKWVKWKATRVWRGFLEDDHASDPEQDSGNEVFMSEDEEDIEGLFNGGSSQDFSDVETEDYPVGCPDWEDPKEGSAHGSNEPSDGAVQVPWTARRKLSGVKAAFVRVTERTGLASWLDEAIFVHVVIDVVYCKGKQVKSFEELYEGSAFQSVADVYIDAVQAREDLWVATLVWTGDRPAKLHVSHSENIFNSVLAETMREEFPGRHSAEGASHGSADSSRVASAAPSESQPSVTICPNSKGVVTDVQQRVAACSVREAGRSRELQFTCFYRDGAVHMYNLDKVLKKGDTVSLDYMVGVSRGKEEVYCDLVWQGQKPLGVLQLSPEDFVERLSMPAPERSVTPRPRATEQLLPDPPSVCSGVTQGGRCESPLRTAQPLEASALVINAAGQQLTATALRERLPGAAIAPAQSVVHSENVVAGNGRERPPPAPERSQHEGAEPSVFIYDGARGTVVRAMESVAWAEVKEGQGSLEVEFTSGCFYRDGEVVLEDLNEVLAKGDEVSLDYMVARTSHGKEVVHCDLVWQGRKPQQAAGRLEPDEFARKLNITEPPCGVLVSFDTLSSQLEQQRDDMPEDSQAPLVELDSTGKPESVENHGISSSLPVAPSNETGCEQPAQVVTTPLATTGAVGAADPRLPAEFVDVLLLRCVKMVTDQLRIEFRDELHRAFAACMFPIGRAVQDGVTQTEDPPPSASPSARDELHRARASYVEPARITVQDGTTQTDDADSPATPSVLDELRETLASRMEPARMVVQDRTFQTDYPDPPASLSSEQSPEFYSPCTSPDWGEPSNAVSLLESEVASPYAEASSAPAVDDDSASWTAETSRELLADDGTSPPVGTCNVDGGASSELVPAMAECSGTQATSNSAAYTTIAEDGTAEDGTAEDGTAEDGTADDGTADDGTADDGTADDGTAEDGTAEDGTAEDGTAHGGTADDGTANATADDETADDGTADRRTVAGGTADNRTVDNQTSDNRIASNGCADNSTADGRLADDTTRGVPDENKAPDLLETSDGIVSGCHPVDTVEPSHSAV